MLHTLENLPRYLVDKQYSQRTASSTEHISSEGQEIFYEKMMPPLHSPSGVITDSQGLIVPKKLVNPCLESTDRQNLHRELLFNQKIGRSVLNQKSELQRVLDKQKERQFVAVQQQQSKLQETTGLGGELGRVIMQRAQRLETLQNATSVTEDEDTGRINPEYVNARAKLKATSFDGK
ncbi:protein FAM107B [Phlebotomus argentipes]|uniref:protein FAM107B n=1 Tax=Phlebotomus argentipes TaxID=94469 RepID=UPI002892F255|nr:protein FAM107B [Phlebotomus argentipes]XP_059611429.1 protein FAM107B [Phlebotomus argentipes]